jgi:hypothetical protein
MIHYVPLGYYLQKTFSYIKRFFSFIWNDVLEYIVSPFDNDKLLIKLIISALFLIALTYSLVRCVSASEMKDYIPTKALQYLPMVSTEQSKLWPSLDHPGYLGGLIELESCISLTHSKCWDPTSRLKTSREEGAGLGQLTRAYTRSGKIRFDTLSRLRTQYYTHLKELSWSNVYQRPDLQIRAIILLVKENYQALQNLAANSFEQLAMADSAYNGGLRDVHRSRRLCGIKKDCDPKYWFNHVEHTCTKSTKALYAGRNPCQINRHHVRSVLLDRAPKYQNLLCWMQITSSPLFSPP